MVEEEQSQPDCIAWREASEQGGIVFDGMTGGWEGVSSSHGIASFWLLVLTSDIFTFPLLYVVRVGVIEKCMYVYHCS